MRKFSDFASEDEKPLEGEKVRLSDLFDKPIVIVAYRIMDSHYKEKNSEKCVIVQFYEVGDKKKKLKIFFTGSGVIKNMIEKYSEELPFQTVIKKIDKYYSFT